MAKEYIKLWDSYESYFESYSAAEVGRLVLAMMKYKSQGVESEFSGSEKFIWPAIRRDIDLDREFTEKKQSSGKSGGKQAQASASTLKQTQAKTSKDKQEYRNTGTRNYSYYCCCVRARQFPVYPAHTGRGYRLLSGAP